MFTWHFIYISDHFSMKYNGLMIVKSAAVFGLPKVRTCMSTEFLGSVQVYTLEILKNPTLPHV